MSGNMSAADRAALPAVARLYADNILNEPAIPPLLRDMADEVERLRLTKEEREAVDTAEASLMRESTDLHTPLPVRQRLGAAAATLRGLLAKHKGENSV